MMKRISQRYSLMKVIGMFYMGMAALLTLAGLIGALLLLRADFYADYRRGMHMIAALLVFVPAALAALAFFVQGSMANAVADIERNTRVNSAAIEESRQATERVVRSGQSAIQNSEAMIHAQAALNAAQRAEAEIAAQTSGPVALPSAGTAIPLEPKWTPAAATANAAPLAPPPPASAIPAAPDRIEVPVATAYDNDLENDAVEADRIAMGKTTISGVISEGGAVSTLQPDLDDEAQPVTASPVDSTDAAVQNLFARAKGAINRTRRPWQPEE